MAYGAILGQTNTTYTKDQILSSSDATLLGLSSTATPADMFNVLATAGDLHVWRRTTSSGVDYPVSTNPNAYQEGSDAGTTIEYLGKLGDKVRIATGSYVGTGTFGPQNPNTLTFEEDVFCVLIANKYTAAILIYPGLGFMSSRNFESVTWTSQKSVSWYANSVTSASYQMNASGSTYQYYAFLK